MNTETGQIYREPEEITAAEERGESLVYGKLAALESIQPLVLNRAARRMRERERRRQANKEKRNAEG